MKPRLIVIEGIDGSGKATQSELLFKYFKDNNKNVKLISFPNYQDDSSHLVKMYLNGNISNNLNEINAFAASSFYACDRYISFKKNWEKYYYQGDIIIADRYVTSNAIHQMVKLPSSKWDNYLSWLYDYEYSKLGLPYPDMTILLDVDFDISMNLLIERYNGNFNKKDIHEKDNEYLIKCYNSYKYISNKYNFDVIKCSNNNVILPKEKILDQIILKFNERF